MLKNLYKRNHGFVKELFLFSYHADYPPVLEPYTDRTDGRDRTDDWDRRRDRRTQRMNETDR